MFFYNKTTLHKVIFYKFVYAGSESAFFKQLDPDLRPEKKQDPDLQKINAEPWVDLSSERICFHFRISRLQDEPFATSSSAVRPARWQIKSNQSEFFFINLLGKSVKRRGKNLCFGLKRLSSVLKIVLDLENFTKFSFHLLRKTGTLFYTGVNVAARLWQIVFWF